LPVPAHSKPVGPKYFFAQKNVTSGGSGGSSQLGLVPLRWGLGTGAGARGTAREAPLHTLACTAARRWEEEMKVQLAGNK